MSGIFSTNASSGSAEVQDLDAMDEAERTGLEPRPEQNKKTYQNMI